MSPFTIEPEIQLLNFLTEIIILKKKKKGFRMENYEKIYHFNSNFIYY